MDTDSGRSETSLSGMSGICDPCPEARSIGSSKRVAELGEDVAVVAELAEITVLRAGK